MKQQNDRAGALEEVLVQVLRAGRGLSKRTWALTGLYFVLAATLVGLTAYLGLRGRPALIEALNTYLFPEAWHAFSSRLVGLILERVPPTLWINGVVLVGLQLAALTLFPLKERISLRLEREQDLVGFTPDEFPIVRQGIEELKLLLVNLALGGLILWLGYSTSPWRRDVASLLSHLHLASFFAVDFMAPLAQRHRVPVERILLTFLKRPVRPLLFGIVMTAPASLVTQAGGDNLLAMIAFVFAANGLPMAWGILAGTRLMSAQLKNAQNEPRPRPFRLAVAMGLCLAIVTGQGVVLGALTSSLHAKSQVLKCEYGLPLDGFKLETPNWLSLVSGSIDLKGHLTLTVDNPTPYDLEMEKNRLEILVRGERWWQGRVPELRAPAGESTRVEIPFAVNVSATQLVSGATKGWQQAKQLWGRVSGVLKRMDSPSAVIDQTERAIATTQLRFEAARQELSVTLFIEILPGFEFPIYLLSPP
jgi:hypothetical protein